MTDDNSRFRDQADRRIKWERMASSWEAAEPPAIPSLGDITIFKRQLGTAFQNTRARSALSLGATWRLRAIFTDLEFSDVSLFCVDWSSKMFDMNSKILGTPPSSEVYIQASWTQFELGQKVSAMIGDKVLDNLPFTEWPAFFDCAARHLLPNGLLILHCAPITDADGAGPKEYLAKWATLLRDKDVSANDAASGFWEDLLTSSAAIGPKEDQILMIGKHDSKLKSLVPADGAESEILSIFYKTFGMSTNDMWCAYRIEDIEQTAAPEFQLVNSENASDYKAAAHQPIISLRKK